MLLLLKEIQVQKEYMVTATGPAGATGGARSTARSHPNGMSECCSASS